MKLIQYNPNTTNSTPVVLFDSNGLKINYEIINGSRKTKRLAF